ncbi:hypothetical protein [Amycolatopsis nigrescens]|uniref:hypothetical protein n=1 Tax=Amycolatopsis nigrescens TaxID=381445 RepID=UPI00036553E0|nr:hypothetical protein [Amycolatopsis nigrescens]
MNETFEDRARSVRYRLHLLGIDLLRDETAKARRLAGDMEALAAEIRQTADQADSEPR